nr:recombinase family protein [Rhodococcus sp. (in: high G+C Gram-positive bacteria)]
MGGESLRDDEADAIRSGVETILRGGTIRAVLRDWQARGLVSAQGKELSHTAVRRILVSPRIAGISMHHGHVVGKGAWPTIIDEDTHRAVTTIMKDPGRRSGNVGGERKYQGTGVYLCGVDDCGSVVQSYNGNNGKKSYRCVRSPHLARRQVDVDEYVDEYIFEKLSGPDARIMLGNRPSKIDVNALTLEREKKQALKNELIDDRLSGIIDAEGLRRGSLRLQAEIAVIDRELARARTDDPLANLLLSGEQLEEAWPKIPVDVRGQIISRLCTVTILPSPRGRRGFDPDFVRIEAVVD